MLNVWRTSSPHCRRTRPPSPTCRPCCPARAAPRCPASSDRNRRSRTGKHFHMHLGRIPHFQTRLASKVKYKDILLHVYSTLLMWFTIFMKLNQVHSFHYRNKLYRRWRRVFRRCPAPPQPPLSCIGRCWPGAAGSPGRTPTSGSASRVIRDEPASSHVPNV